MSALVIALLEDVANARAVKQSLESAGHTVLAVTCFRDAKAQLQAYPFDLIISDVHLENGGTVFDFLRWVRSNERFKSIPFVLLSVEPTSLARYLSDGVRISARHLGASKYIVMDCFDAKLLHLELAEFLPLNQAEKVSESTNI